MKKTFLLLAVFSMFFGSSFAITQPVNETNGVNYGYLNDVYKKGSTYYLSIDYIQYYQGYEAALARAEDGLIFGDLDINFNQNYPAKYYTTNRQGVRIATTTTKKKITTYLNKIGKKGYDKLINKMTANHIAIVSTADIFNELSETERMIVGPSFSPASGWGVEYIRNTNTKIRNIAFAPTVKITMDGESATLADLSIRSDHYTQSVVKIFLKNSKITGFRIGGEPVTAVTTTTLDTTTLPNEQAMSQEIAWKFAGMLCNWVGQDGKLNDSYFTSAKLVNTMLQKVRDSGGKDLSKYIKDAKQKIGGELSMSSTAQEVKTACTYSWLADALERQQGYIKSYTTKNGKTTIDVDLVSYQDDPKKIDYAPALGPIHQIKNDSSKTRTYTLAKNPELQTLYTDSQGQASSDQKKIYLNNFSKWTNQFCGGEGIYTTDSTSNWNANNSYCIKKLLPNKISSISFDTNNNITKIDLDWLGLSTAN